VVHCSLAASQVTVFHKKIQLLALLLVVAELRAAATPQNYTEYDVGRLISTQSTTEGRKDNII